MNAISRLLDYSVQLFNAGFSSVHHLKRASDIETASEDGEYDCLKFSLKCLVEGAVNKDVLRVPAEQRFTSFPCSFGPRSPPASK